MTRGVGEDARARLRLVPSDGEIVCPKKGQLAIGRCLELQHELLCTCPTYLAYRGPDPETLRIPDKTDAAQAVQPEDEEDMAQKNGGTARVLAALRRAPERVFSVSDLAKAKGGSEKALSVMMTRLVRVGMAVRAAGGYKAGPSLLGEPVPAAVEVVRNPPPRADPPRPVRAAKAPPPPEDEHDEVEVEPDEHEEREEREDEGRSEVVEAGPARPAEVPKPSPAHAPAATPAPAPMPPIEESRAHPIDTARAVASLRWALDGVAAGFIDLDGFQRHLERVRGGL